MSVDPFAGRSSATKVPSTSILAELARQLVHSALTSTSVPSQFTSLASENVLTSVSRAAPEVVVVFADVVVVLPCRHLPRTRPAAGRPHT
ncbi:MAG: hypothetical protein DYH08_06250 [Actinobacteria bacterium ATB1]|nr:hypothetical protein [Actinobacteria bacterium ATB1]